MLLSFRVANHRSLRDEQHLLLVPVTDDEGEEEGQRSPAALPVAGVFGANASGKSNVLDALAFMQRVVRWSMRDHEPDSGITRFPFALDRESLAKPSTYAVDLLLDGVRHTYGFAIDDERVVEEWMYAYPGGDQWVVFERDGESYEFGAGMPESVVQVKEITEENMLFLTVAARSKQDAVRPVYNWFSFALGFRAPGRERRMLQSSRYWSGVTDEQLSDIERLLRAADTGIDRLEIRRRDQSEGETAEIKDMVSSEIFQRERVRGSRASSARLFFHHRAAQDGIEPLGINQQSDGTIVLLDLARIVMSVLSVGGVFVVDELDANLHPHLSAKIIELFENPETNPKGAQLIFSSHDAALLGWVRGKDVLRREEIWFVEKDRSGASELIPLSDFEDEGESNRALWYLTGRYGGVPEVVDSEFDAIAPDTSLKEQDGLW